MGNRVIISKKLVIINSASSLVTRLLSISVLIWVQQYLLKNLSVEEYSLLPVIYSLMIFLPLLTTTVTGGIERYVLGAYAENNDERITQIVSSIFPVLCLVSIFVCILGGVLAWKIDWILRIDPEYIDDAQIMLMLLMVNAALKMMMMAFNSGLYVKQRFVLMNLIVIFGECIRMALLFALLFGFKVSVISVVLATFVASLVEGVTLLVVSRQLLPSLRFERSKFEWSIVKELTSFGGWSSLIAFTGLIRKASDAIILNRLATPLDVAYFHLGSLVPNRLEVIVNRSFLGPVSPVVVGLNADGQADKLKNAYLRLGRLALWGLLLVIAPFFVHLEQIVTLYVGTTYLSAGTVMFLLLACYPVIYGNILFRQLANAKIRMRSLALRDSISAAANLSLTILLVGYYQLGAIGAAISTFIVHGLGSILLFWPFGKGMVAATWLEVWSNILKPGILPFIAALIVMKSLEMSYPAESWITIGANALLGSVVYLIAIWFVAKEVDKIQFKDALHSLFLRK